MTLHLTFCRRNPDHLTPLEQVINILDTYADDQDACVRKQWVRSRSGIRECRARAATYRDAAAILTKHRDLLS